MNYSTYFSQYFVYSVLTLIGSQLTDGLECYTHTDTDKTTISRTGDKTDLCYIDKDTNERAMHNGAAWLTLEPEKPQCVLHKQGETRCYCSTDLCNKNFPSQPDIQPMPIGSLTCVLHPQQNNKATCNGYVCYKLTKKTGESIRECDYIFFGKKKNGCVKEAYRPEYMTRMCYCDTNMCDPSALSDLNETNNESQHTTDPSTQSDPNGTTLYTINVLMMVFLVWTVSE